jgi:hypothetical protein
LLGLYTLARAGLLAILVVTASSVLWSLSTSLKKFLYKEELIKSQKQNERLTTLVGKVTVEKEWLAKKLKSLGLSNRKPLVELKLSSPHMPCSLLSVNQQCQ